MVVYYGMYKQTNAIKKNSDKGKDIHSKISLQIITIDITIFSCVTLFVLCKQRPKLSL